ncbi:hypothetical protein RhiirA4_473768 [Rhizophagus irregularis]|uniref:Uncharacterized protein n=1 Tax=Rhizophagus irregularis TaxID=588596 RepID=A0A2I1H7D7_9GLOM|nr:hypothetical protein RhiirA4_473768 [Rhizophagus irregularis]
MGLVTRNGKIPSWYRTIIAIPNLSSFLPQITDIPTIPLPLSSLIGKFVDQIDTSSHICYRNKYYWIVGLDSTNSLIFRRVFYTVDDKSGNRVVYFSHWIPSTHDRMTITPCPGCSLHCLEDNEGPLALKSVGGKLIHKSCLSILPSYRCLQLFQMTVNIDSSQKFINLKLSSFILCSYFRFLLGFSEIYIPERFLISDIAPSKQNNRSSILPVDLTTLPPPVFALQSNTKFFISGAVHVVDSLTSYLVCAWVQADDDYILESGIFSCPMISPFSDVTKLAFVIYALNSLSANSSVEFLSSFHFEDLFLGWSNSSPTRRTRLKNNTLWSCISELLRHKDVSCNFTSFTSDATSALSLRAKKLLADDSWHHSLQPTPLHAIFPISLRTMGLFTGYDELLTQDPVKY